MGSSPDISTAKTQHDEACSERRIAHQCNMDQAAINFMSFLLLLLYLIKQIKR